MRYESDLHADGTSKLGSSAVMKLLPLRQGSSATIRVHTGKQVREQYRRDEQLPPRPKGNARLLAARHVIQNDLAPLLCLKILLGLGALELMPQYSSPGAI